MKVFILTFLLWITVTWTLRAESPPSSDAEALTTVLLTAIEKILEHHNPFPGKTVTVAFLLPNIPSNSVKDAVEAVLTSYGCAINDSDYKADSKLDIAITDTRVIIQPHNNGFKRTVWLTVHVKCLDSSRKVIFASGREEISGDEILSQFIGITDDSDQFCKNTGRSNVGKNHVKLRLFSFILLAGILAYFAFQ